MRARNRELPVHVIHADSFTNDFNQVFRDAAESYRHEQGGPIYVSARAGSFFDQMMPSGAVHLGMCSNAAHWLREQPQIDLPNGMYFSDARGVAREKLARQAADDWLGFLRARANEILPGGRMFVQGIATTKTENGAEKVSGAKLLHLMWEIAGTVADDALLDRSVLLRYLFPVYCRTREEAIAPMGDGDPLSKEFQLVTAEVSEVGNPYWEEFERSGDATAYRATTPLLFAPSRNRR